MPTTPPKREKGAASVIVTLREGQLIVQHGDTKEILITRRAPLGFWCNDLWPLLRGK